MRGKPPRDPVVCAAPVDVCVERKKAMEISNIDYESDAAWVDMPASSASAWCDEEDRPGCGELTACRRGAEGLCLVTRLKQRRNRHSRDG